MRRIFIAINLPAEVKDKIIKKVYDKDLPGRFISKENLHLTLVFLGYLKDEDLGRVERVCTDIVRHTMPFYLTIKKAVLAPQNRMIWGVFKDSKRLKSLQNRLKLALESALVTKREKRPYLPHLTLSRVKQKDRKKIARMWQNIDLNLGFEVHGIEIMESELSPKGARYQVLKTLTFLNKNVNI